MNQKTELPIRFPAIGFTRNGWDKWAPGSKSVELYEDESDLTVLIGHALDGDALKDALIIDSAGKSWRVVEVVDLGPHSWIGKYLIRRKYRNYRIRPELVEEPTLPLAELMDLTAEAMRADPDSWRDDEAVAGESGEPRDEDEMMEERIVKLRRAKSVKGLITAMKRLNEEY